jgi:radical SAM superfamily enzyme YgiQ (UPF0313 family)
MRITFVHPSIGRRPGENYMRTWQMESLPVAALSALTPDDVETRFYDDRMEPVAYDEPADLVAIPVETYTAKRAYQIASEYRRRGVPVVMGGFHATLMPQEVSRYAEATVMGEAEAIWPEIVDDARHGTLKPPFARRCSFRPLRLSGQAIPAARPGRDRTRLPLPMRILRHPDLLQPDASPPSGRRDHRRTSSHKARAQAVLLRRRQFRGKHSRSARTGGGDRTTRYPLGDPDECRCRP